MSTPRKTALERGAGWVIVFLANLVVPVLWGTTITKSGGLVGMIAAIIALLLLSTWLVIAIPALGVRLHAGGMILIFSQLFPALQMMAGMFALNVWQTLTGGTESNLGRGDALLAEAGGFAVTVMTAQPMLVLALILGTVIVHFNYSQPAQTPTPNTQHDS